MNLTDKERREECEDNSILGTNSSKIFMIADIL